MSSPNTTKEHGFDEERMRKWTVARLLGTYGESLLELLEDCAVELPDDSQLKLNAYALAQSIRRKLR